MTLNEQAPKPCPFCGNTHITNEGVNFCGQCGAFGPQPVYDMPEITTWNTRADAALPTQVTDEGFASDHDQCKGTHPMTTEQVKDDEIARLKAHQEKDWANINTKADFIEATINQLATADDELTTLRAENKRLRELVSELASDVESDVKAKYCDRDGAITHPSYVRKFNRDMSVVVEARSAIDEDNHSPITALKEQGE